MKMSLIVTIFIFGFMQVPYVNGFFGLETDLQFSYQITDLSNEINGKLKQVSNIVDRPYSIQTDKRVKICFEGLKELAINLQKITTFYSDVQDLGMDRTNNEGYIIKKLSTSQKLLTETLESTLNSSGLLVNIGAVMNIMEVEKIESNLRNILENSQQLFQSFNVLARDITTIRSTRSSYPILSPKHIRDSLNEFTRIQILGYLSAVNTALDQLIISIKDISRVALAQGSIYQTLYTMYVQEFSKKTLTLDRFNNSHNVALNNILSVANQNNVSSHEAFNMFFEKIRTKYNDDIVRSTFEDNYLKQINNFINLTVDYIYNVDRIRSNFNLFRDEVLNSQGNTTDFVFQKTKEIRKAIILKQRTYFIKDYSTCVDDMVSSAQHLIRSSTSKYLKCINERTSGVNLILPTFKSSLNVFRDNVNYVLEQLNLCISSSTSVEARSQTLECLDNTIVNLPDIASLLVQNARKSEEKILKAQTQLYETCVQHVSDKTYQNIKLFYVDNAQCNNFSSNATTRGTNRSVSSINTTVADISSTPISTTTIIADTSPTTVQSTTRFETSSKTGERTTTVDTTSTKIGSTTGYDLSPNTALSNTTTGLASNLTTLASDLSTTALPQNI